MTDQVPGRTPPWMREGWALTVRPPAQPVRIGDAERDEALDRLGDHFAAGRLTREEFDERSGAAIGARFDSDLEPLFRDLPKPAGEAVERRRRPSVPAGIPVVVMLLVPLLVLAVVASIALHGPVLVAPLLWLVILSGAGRRHRFH